MKSSIVLKSEIQDLGNKMLHVASDASLPTSEKATRLRPLQSQLEELQAERSDVEHVEKQLNMLRGAGVSGDHGAVPAAPTSGSLAQALAAQGKSVIAPPQLSLDNDQIADLYNAAVSHKSLRIETKVPVASSGIAPSTIPNYRLPPVTFAREPQRILSLMPNVSSDRPVEVFYQTAGTTAAGPVAEAGTKPSSTIAYTPVTVNATKLAHVVEVTDETLQDMPSFSQYLSMDMVAGVMNAELLSAAGTGASRWPGLLNQTGILTRAKATETYSLDVIEEAVDDLRVGTSFTEPTDIVLHPSTWGTLRRTKDVQNRYIVEPDPTAQTRLSLWGFPVTLTTAMPVGKALIGDFAGGCYAFVRQGITVDTANQGSLQFTTNTTLVRAETRLGLCVVRPSAFILASGL